MYDRHMAIVHSHLYMFGCCDMRWSRNQSNSMMVTLAVTYGMQYVIYVMWYVKQYVMIHAMIYVVVYVIIWIWWHRWGVNICECSCLCDVNM